MSTSNGSDRDGADRTDKDRPHVPGVPGTQSTPQASSATSVTQRRRDVVEREKDAHGGLKIGSAFFGWLTATGMAVLLTAILVAGGTAVGLSTVDNIDKATSKATSEAGTIGLAGAIALLVIVFVAYLCGGYVAGRMARFNGLIQGLGVWLWAVAIAIVIAVVAAVAGSKYDVLSNLNSFPRLPVDEGDLGLAGVVTIAAVAGASLVGALLGGLLGMRFHRRVDKAGLGA